MGHKDEHREEAGTGDTHIIESLEGLKIKDGGEVAEKTAISNMTSGVETTNEEVSSSKEKTSSPKREENSPSANDVSASRVAKGQKDRTPSWIKDSPAPEPWVSPSQVHHLFTPARKRAAQSKTTADVLIENVVISDEIPGDPLVRRHFGYSKVNSFEEETCLQGLYKALLDLLPSSPSSDEVQQWVQQDKLAEGIDRYYSRFGAQSGYFNWFKRNKHVFSQSYERAGGPWAPDGEWFDNDRKKLDELTKSDSETEEDD